MVLIMIISNLCGERYSPINALFLSWGIILFFSPYSLFSKSLVLSFGATFGILACFEHLQRLWNRLVKLPATRNKRLEKIMVSSKKFLGGSLSVSVSAFVGTVYFCAVFFGRISKVQFLTNLWIVPVANLVFCIGAIACIIYSFLPHFALAVFFYPLRLLLWIITATIDTFGTEKFAFKILGEISPVFLIIYIGAVILFYETIKTFSDIQKEKAAKERAARKKLKNS
jgi:ComEC/Rec2-related protein